MTHDIDEAFLLGDQVVIMQHGGKISQAASPAEILASPADDFVADFVGANRGKRALHVTEVDGRRLVVDADGRPAGVLAS